MTKDANGAGDFGEPWAPKSFNGGAECVTVDRNGRTVFRMIDGPMEPARVRIQALVNTFAGVPTADLPAYRQHGIAAAQLLVLLKACKSYLHSTAPRELTDRLDEILGRS